jgi:hypothetical protein
MYYPLMTERLIILSVPHPQGLFRELTTNPNQQNNSSYAFKFQEEDAHKSRTVAGLAGWVQHEAEDLVTRSMVMWLNR